MSVVKVLRWGLSPSLRDPLYTLLMPSWHLHLRHEHGSIIKGRKSAEWKNGEKVLKMSRWLAACAESLSAAISHIDSAIRRSLESTEADCSSKRTFEQQAGTVNTSITLDFLFTGFNQRIILLSWRCHVQQQQTHTLNLAECLVTHAVITPISCLLLSCLSSCIPLNAIYVGFFYVCVSEISWHLSHPSENFPTPSVTQPSLIVT